MNYSTECLEHLLLSHHAVEALGFTRDANAIKGIMSDLATSTKFLIPPPDKMNVKVTASSLNLLKLPYPICAFEYYCPSARDEPIEGLNSLITAKSSKRIALAYDCSKNVGPVAMLKASGRMQKDADGILVISLYYLDNDKLWNASFGAGYIDKHTGEDFDNMLFDNKSIQTKMDVYTIMGQCAYRMYGKISDEQETMALMNDVADETAMAIRACLMLNTKNLKVVKAIEAPAKLNKKRAKNKKPPFFEYLTLDIFVSQSGSRLDRKKVNYSALQKHFDSLSVDRRWGTVMGHFKVRSTGVFWWSEHGRGSKNAGIIQKDYQVKHPKDDTN
jgi:hypothetical protein